MTNFIFGVIDLTVVSPLLFVVDEVHPQPAELVLQKSDLVLQRGDVVGQLDHGRGEHRRIGGVLGQCRADADWVDGFHGYSMPLDEPSGSSISRSSSPGRLWASLSWFGQLNITTTGAVWIRPKGSATRSWAQALHVGQTTRYAVWRGT
jgi:hypothetical protein